MTKYLISFPSSAMKVSPGELPAVADAAHAVIREMKEAGVYVFGGGVNEGVPAVLVAADGSVTEGTYPETAQLDGGFTVIEAPTRAEAERWATKTAAACRCSQELREFQYDPLV
ncbi:hypothetical protein GCM10022286_11810 [Gryllotalpicola daejeonensis]|uniref:YCII-related domain-containing protein n=1 Tax=Gryllotalpicola daejeonensis TaxID=993087 RepID=A0ABP7ZHY8_9MICO